MNPIRAEAVLALLLAIAAVHNNWRANRGSDAVDFYQFWLVGQAAGEVRDPYAPEARRALGEAGFDSHLVKPVDYATLTKLLASFPLVAAADRQS